jgi:outer membrane cobalamin receptor
LVPEKFWADVKLYARSPNLKDGEEIPYEEKLGIKGAVSFRPLKELTINGWTEYIGSRESPETNTTLDAFLLLNAGAEYQINETFGVYAKLLNLMGQEYEIWNGYQERPLQIFGGLTIKF